ncbi:hypothetical protein [Helicobacter pylori]|uniref:hypothetical protein n=1 Tax=Helicobacter pylori TaxID=210 RepID=UPI0003FCB350|nr:hypothetical protein [Helicobacter pylori]
MKDFSLVKNKQRQYKQNKTAKIIFKLDFLGYVEVVGCWKEILKDGLLSDKEVSFFVFLNELISEPNCLKVY